MRHCKGFTVWQQFVAMSYARLAAPNVLRSFENSNCAGLYHLGIRNDLKHSTPYERRNKPGHVRVSMG
ncbi:DUF4372 domain-containing protein [uncultured Treponema sp.]|uniref:DUF4372 domain-containing protein n=1 Tax=uncultured Treponema sp. TaxID=162155 RepID=UPI0034139B27